MTKEIPYEALNSLQNPSVQHGQNIYMRGVTQREFSPECTKKVVSIRCKYQTRVSFDLLVKVFERLSELSSKDMRASVIFELYPLDKIRSVPNDATAFNLRGPENNVFCITLWDEDTAERSVQGKETCYAITNIVSNAEENPDVSAMRAYGNYGEDEFFLLPSFRCSHGLLVFFQSEMRG